MLVPPDPYDPYGGLELQISPTDLCGFKCVMCMQTAHLGLYGDKSVRAPVLHGGRRGFMDMNLFCGLLAQLADSRLRFRLLKLQWMGEALMHPSFPEMLVSAAESGLFPVILLNTNGAFLDDTLRAVLKVRRPSRIILIMSMDAVTEKTFSTVKGVDLFQNVMQNFTKTVRQCPDITPVAQMLIMHENFHEAPDFLNYWGALFRQCGRDYDIIVDQEAVSCRPERAKIFFKKVGGADDAALSILHRNACYSASVIDEEALGREIITRSSDTEQSAFKVVPAPCPAPFRTPLVNWDGRVTTCCMDTELENCFGDLNVSGFSEIWKGERHMEIRKLHLTGDRKLLPRCLRCINLDAAPLKPEELDKQELIFV